MPDREVNPYQAPNQAAHPAADAAPTSVRWLILILLMGVVAIAHFNRISISVAGAERIIDKPDSGHPPTGISEQQMGWVYSAFLIVYTAGMLPGGWIIDRFGPRAALAGMGLAMGLCVALTGVTGLAGLTGTSLWLGLLAIRSLAGASSVPLHPAAAHAVSHWFPPRLRATANGLVTAAALVAIANTYPLFGRMMDRLDWPLAFVICGMAMMIYGLVWLSLAADGPEQHAWTNAAERQLAQGGDVVAPAQGGPSLSEIMAVFLDRGLVLLALSYGAFGYFQYLFFYWMQFYFDKVLKMSEEQGRNASYQVAMSMAAGMIAGGWCADWLGRQIGAARGRTVVAMAGMGLSAAFALLGIFTQWQVVLLLSLANGAAGLCEGSFWTAATVRGGARRGLACAFLNTGGNAGGTLAPVLTPYLADKFGWTAAIAVACAVCAAGSLCWLGAEDNDEARKPNDE